MDTDKQECVQRKEIKMEIGMEKKNTLRMITRMKYVHPMEGDMITYPTY